MTLVIGKEYENKTCGSRFVVVSAKNEKGLMVYTVKYTKHSTLKGKEVSGVIYSKFINLQPL